MSCDGCVWDRVKRYERDMNWALYVVTAMPEITRGPRPEHTCGRPSFDAAISQGVDALLRLQDTRTRKVDQTKERMSVKRWLRLLLEEVELSE